jgi:hypothetical protein
VTPIRSNPNKSTGERISDRSKAKSWLFTTLYHEFLGRRRHEVRFPRVELDEACEEEMSISPNVNAFDSATVLQALREVEEPFRAPLTGRGALRPCLADRRKRAQSQLLCSSYPRLLFSFPAIKIGLKVP